MSEWTDAIVGERMTVDNQFNERVAASRFSSQEWGLIMTAIDFEIENADDPEEARVVAENLRSQMAGMGGAPAGDAGGSSGGVVDAIKGALGLGGGGGAADEELEAAERLVQEYADELQAHLEDVGKWEQVRVAYQE